MYIRRTNFNIQIHLFYFLWCTFASSRVPIVICSYVHAYGTAQMQRPGRHTRLLTHTILASLHVCVCLALASLHVHACLALTSLHVCACLVCASLLVHVCFLCARLLELNDNSLHMPDTFKTATFINSLTEWVI